MKQADYEQMTIGRQLEDRARTIAEKIYLLHNDQRITYREMNENVNRVANSLIAMGVKKGDKVCVIMTNSVEFLYAWFALSKIGAIEVPINHALKGNLLRYIIENSEASIVVVDAELADRVLLLQDELKKIGTIVVLHDKAPRKPISSSRFAITDFEALYRGSPVNPASNVNFWDPR